MSVPYKTAIETERNVKLKHIVVTINTMPINKLT